MNLKLNGDKTEVMLSASRHTLRNLPSLFLRADGASIKSLSAVKTLGVYIDTALDMCAHVNHTICKPVLLPTLQYWSHMPLPHYECNFFPY